MCGKHAGTKQVNHPPRNKPGLTKETLSTDADLQARGTFLMYIKVQSVNVFSATTCEIPVRSLPSVASKVITEYYFLFAVKTHFLGQWAPTKG